MKCLSIPRYFRFGDIYENDDLRSRNLEIGVLIFGRRNSNYATYQGGAEAFEMRFHKRPATDRSRVINWCY